MAPMSEFECWYGNGFGAAQWKADKKDKLVKSCTLRLTEDKLFLLNGKANVSCPWAGIDVRAGASPNGNAVLTLTMRGEAGGTAKIVLPGFSPNAFWAEIWRVAPALRPHLNHAKPDILGVSATAEVLLEYLGGYPLRPKKSATGLWVEMSPIGLTVKSGFRKQREMLLPWKDITEISLEGMMDPQRQRSLARTVEFGALGGLAARR